MRLRLHTIAALCAALVAVPLGRPAGATSAYETVVTVDNTGGGALTDHQVSFTFDSATPIAANKLQADGDDLRVTDDDGTAVPFALQGPMNSSSTVVWVKLAAIPAASTVTLRLYYGDTAATSTSDPDDVFDYWEGFDDSSTDFSIACGDLVWSINGGTLFLSWTTKGIFLGSTTFALTPAYVAEASVLTATGRWPGLHWFKSSSQHSYALVAGNSAARIGELPSSTTNGDRCAAHVWVTSQLPIASTAGIWGLTWPAYGSQIGTFPNIATLTATDTDHQRDSTMLLGLGGISTGTGGMSVDWLRVRRYVAAQPGSTVGSEHEACVLDAALCDDGNACTTDACTPASGCTHTTITCDDASACTTDSCNTATGCVFTPVSCGDGDACTDDGCNPASGCTHAATDCDDVNACTADSCNTTTGCQHATITCDDVNACTTNLCDVSAGCLYPSISCADGDACTLDTCDPSSGCAHTTIVCDDHTVCTTDTCDVATGCIYTPIDCDDADACTTESCDAVTGCGHAAVDCDDQTVCTTESCDPATGCAHATVDCDDHSACTTESCDAVTGCGHAAIDCDDGTVCTTDACDPATGCTHTTIDCDDHSVCTTDGCDAIAGCGHVAIDCDDHDACTTDTCDAATGCAHVPVDCDDRDACTTDTCDPASGCGHTPVVCDDDDVCTANGCAAATGCLFTAIPCGDGDPCTDDLCIHPNGCNNPPTTGATFPSLTCQVGWLRAGLDAIKASRSVDRWFGRRIARADATFTAARTLAESGDLLAARRRLRTARTLLHAFIRRAERLQKRGRLVEPAGGALRTTAFEVLVDVEALLELLSGTPAG